MKFPHSYLLLIIFLVGTKLTAQNSASANAAPEEHHQAVLMTCQDQNQVFGEYLRFAGGAIECDCLNTPGEVRDFSMLMKVFKLSAEEMQLAKQDWQSTLLPKIIAGMGGDLALESSLKLTQNETEAYILSFRTPEERKIAAVLQF